MFLLLKDLEQVFGIIHLLHIPVLSCSLDYAKLQTDLTINGFLTVFNYKPVQLSEIEQ